MATTETVSRIAALEANLARALLGKSEAIRQVVVALLAEGHVLIEDVPGVGKTVLARALAASIEGKFTRLQCTPDLLPSDILGTGVFLPQAGDFEFRPGPVFTNVLLADEVNRTTPRTQSALLEAMNERQVSVDGITHALPNPFVLVATQNPYEYEGTYPLPENQRDRFLVCLEIGYPDRSIELEMLQQHHEGGPLSGLEPVLKADELLALQATCREVTVEESIREYLLNIVTGTRDHQELSLGASPRGAIALFRAAQALALCDGRDYTVPDDVKTLAPAVLAHRVICRGPLRDSGRDRGLGIIRQIIESTPVPT
ncbi:MAG TPA: ATPase [Planctomycetaceae bacterium]|nr:MoxR family ATPase [Planctomycetales bacterium]HAA60844.1 ATPase [Planctomycetaceae bacterium]